MFTTDDLLTLNGGRLKARKREGYVFKHFSDAEEEEAADMGWQHIRKAKVDANGVREAVGKETGEVVRLAEGDNHYLYAMEINEERMQRHHEMNAQTSRGRFTSATDSAHALADEANSQMRGKQRIKTFDLNEVPRRNEVIEGGPGDIVENGRAIGKKRRVVV